MFDWRTGPEVERLMRQRVGRNDPREALHDDFGGACVVTSLALSQVLRASHAKPWPDCAGDKDQPDVFNGFLLAAQFDALFDRGLTTYGVRGGIVITSHLKPDHHSLLHLDERNPRLRWVAPKHLRLLQWHQDRIFLRRHSADPLIETRTISVSADVR